MISKELAKHIINTTYKNIPKEDIEKGKLCFIDYLGVTIRGFQDKTPQTSLKTLNHFKNNKPSKLTIIGSNTENFLDELNTAFINGISAHTLDLDDGHRIGQLHPGAIVFSTALSLSEYYNLNSKEFLESVIVGYDIGIILSSLINPTHRNQGFHTSGTIGTFIAGAVASKLLKLNKKQIINTLGLCGTQSSGLLEADHSGSMAKPLHIGRSINNGILSAYLAKNDFTGPENIIEGNEGFIKAMSSDTKLDTNFYNKFKNNLKTHHIQEVYHKLYPFCRHLHSSIDSTLNLKQYLLENNTKLNEIETIKINTYKIASEHDNFKPTNPQELKQSLALAVAISLKYGSPDLNLIEKLTKKDLFTYQNNDLNKIIDKITINFDENLDKEFPLKRTSNIILKTKNTPEVSFSTEYPKGEIENPLTINDIIKKFKGLNPNYDISKLHIIKNMENYEFNTVLNKIK